MIAEWLDRADGRVIPINQRRQRLRAIAQQELRGDRSATTRGRRPGRCARRSTWRGRPSSRSARRPPAARPVAAAAGVDGRRPAPRRRGQLAPQRPAARLRPRRRRRGAGPLGGGPAGDRPAQSPASSMTLVGDVAQSTTPAGQERWADVFAHLAAARGAGRGRRADDRLPRAGADPRRRQPPAPADRRRRHAPAAACAPRATPPWWPPSPPRRRRGGRSRRRRQAPPPPDRRRRPAAATSRSPPALDEGLRRGRPRPPARPRRGPAVRAERSRASSSTAWSSSSPTRSSTARRAAPACCTWR